MTILDLLINHVMGAPIKMINVVVSNGYDIQEAKNLDEIIRYFGIYSRGYHLAYQRQGKNYGQIDRDREREWHNRDKDCEQRDNKMEYDRYVPLMTELKAKSQILWIHKIARSRMCLLES